MKKLVSLLTVGFLSLFVIFGGELRSNYQKIYAVGDPVYDWIVDLSLLEGKSLPSTTGPFSGSELKAMIEKIDYQTLSEYGKELYDRIDSVLEEDASSSVFKASLEIAPEAYINSNYSSTFFQTRDNWYRGWSEQKQLVNIITEEHIGNNFYGYFNFSLGTAKDHTSRSFGDSLLWTNIPFLLQNDMKQLDFNFPLRAFVSAGGEHWSLFVGRDRLSWGNGKTGNFIIGDHIKYHNAAYFKAYDGNFKYTFLISAFPHPQNYYKVDENGTKMTYSHNGLGRGQSDYMNGISAFIAHRLEWNILPSLSFTLTEGVMYMSKDNKIDLIAFAPAMMYHNNYTRSNTNSILAFELDWTIIKGLNVYGQVVIDESVLPGEPNPKTTTEDNPAEPNGRGFLLGATYKMVVKKGVLTFNLEGAVTDPYLYLRDGDKQAGEINREQTNGRYGINYVIALREMSNCGGTENYNLDFLGYRYGGDALVAYLAAGYSVPGEWNAGLGLFFMIHGTHDKYTVWTRVNKDTNKTTPTSEHQTENYNDPDAKTTRNSPSLSVVSSLSGSYSFFSFLSLSAEVDFIWLKNAGNIKSNKTLFDTQTTISLSYTWK